MARRERAAQDPAYGRTSGELRQLLAGLRAAQGPDPTGLARLAVAEAMQASLEPRIRTLDPPLQRAVGFP